MGKRSMVVIDIGRFNTKICVFQNLGQKYVLQSGAIFDTPNDIMSDEFFQRCDIFLSKLNVNGCDLYTIFSETEDNYTIETEFPSGNNREIEKMVKDRYQALSKNGAADSYYSWQTVGTPESTGQTRIMIAYAKKAHIDKMAALAEKYKMTFVKADLSSTAIDGMARALQQTQSISTSAPNVMYSLLDIGSHSANLVLFNQNSVFKIVNIKHTLFKLDDACTGSMSTLMYDKSLNKEQVKMIPELVTQVSQYDLSVRPFITSVIKEILMATENGKKFINGPLFVSGGLAKIPFVAQKIANDIGTQYYDFPIREFVDIADNCIYRSNKKIYPCDEVFATALGTVIGGV